MISEHDLIKMVFGFKIKYLRQQKRLSYKQLSESTGLSTSYLHDIEKGRKYPKVDKITALGDALGVSYDFLVSMQASKKLQPIVDLFTSDFMKQFPLDLFGIRPEKLFELFSTAPDKLNAFIRTIFKVTRSYQFQQESIYEAALRSYQDMFDNYFPELEEAVKTFKDQAGLPRRGPYRTSQLQQILRDQFGITTDRQRLATELQLQKRRSVFVPSQRTLYLNERLKPAQEHFLLGREIGFQYLQLSPRPLLTRMVDSKEFDVWLNNFKASYFSVALLMDEDHLCQDFSTFLKNPEWDPTSLLALLDQYQVTPEMLLQRLTNILPHHLQLSDLFFIRLSSNADLENIRMTKDLHLSQLHSPYANESNEHYCRRWVSATILADLGSIRNDRPIAQAQISQYHNSDKSYVCLSFANSTNLSVSVTLGILINDDARHLIRFIADPQLRRKTVHTTCERCSIPDCQERASPPSIWQKNEEKRQEKLALDNFMRKH